MVTVLQGDFTLATCTEEVPAWLEGCVVNKLTCKQGIKLSQKDATTQPFAEVLSTIGEMFDARVEAPKVSPNKPVI